MKRGTDDVESSSAQVVIYLVSLNIVGDEWGTDATVAFGLLVAVLIAAVSYFVAGITTPKSPVSSR